MINYNHHIESCDKVHNLEQILKQYDNIKIDILDKLKKNCQDVVNHLWQIYLGVDYYCQNESLCSQCELLTHIQPQYMVNTPFQIKIGDYLILTKNKVDYPFLKINHNQIKGDVFTIKLLITWIINQHLEYYQLPLCIHLYNGFICNHYGYLLYKIPVINEELCHFDRLLEYKYSNNIVYGILTQLITLFHTLSKLDFSMGHPSQQSFLFDKTPCQYIYIYNNIRYNIQCDYTLKLSDLSESSLKFNNILLFPQNCVNELIHNHFKKTYCQIDNNMFVITKDVNPLFNNIKFTLPSSIDLYLVILSMMCNDNFFNTVMENQDCYDIWKSLWVDNQENMMEQRLIDMKENQPIDTLLSNIHVNINPYKNIFNNINVV